MNPSLFTCLWLSPINTSCLNLQPKTIMPPLRAIILRSKQAKTAEFLNTTLKKTGKKFFNIKYTLNFTFCLSEIIVQFPTSKIWRSCWKNWMNHIGLSSCHALNLAQVKGAWRFTGDWVKIWWMELNYEHVIDLGEPMFCNHNTHFSYH